MPYFLDQPIGLLGGFSPNEFMQHYWQKQPGIFQNNLTAFQSPISIPDLLSFSRLDTVESRLVQQKNGEWKLSHGPFKRLPTASTPNWTVLIQGVNAHHANTAAFLDLFRFIPTVRLDDIMISYASEGGGVGPHFDSYDVFLIQAYGEREWRIGELTDFSVRPDVPVKLLKHFAPSTTIRMRPGDVLYLPPRWGHDGVALTNDCVTISVGFRTPIAHELQAAALEYIAEALLQKAPALLPEMYTDADQIATNTPGEIPSRLIDYTQDLLNRITFDSQTIEDFLGRWFSEPKQHLFFDAPLESLDLPSLEGQYQLRVHPKSILIYGDNHNFYMNGENYCKLHHPVFTQLANCRVSNWKGQDTSLQAHDLDTLQEWLDAGWIEISTLE